MCKSSNFCLLRMLKLAFSSHNLASGKRANTELNLYEISTTCSRAVLLLFPIFCSMSDSLGLVDFVIGLVNSVLNLPDGQVNF